MEKSLNALIGKRLKEARKCMGLTLGEVAEKMGFASYQTLGSIESGKREIKAWELAKLARIYYRDVSYFLSEEQETKSFPVLWRTKSSSPEVKSYERKFVRFCENYACMEELSGLKPPESLDRFKYSKADFSFSFVKKLAGRYSAILQLGRRPACSLARVLGETFAVKVLRLQMGTEGSGASTWGPFGPAILVNADEVPWRQNFSLAHELFHLLTVDVFKTEEIYRSSTGEKSKVEQFADSFASTLLLPRDEVRQEFEPRIRKGKISYLDCVEIAGKFGVSTQALLWSLVDLKLVNREEARRVIADPELRSLDPRLPFSDFTQVSKFPDRYVAIAFRCMQLGQISRGKFAEFMEIDRQEIPGFLSRYGLDEDKDYSFELPTRRR